MTTLWGAQWEAVHHYRQLVELVRERIMENHCFTIMELSCHFPQISRSLLHKIVMEHLFRKLCIRWGAKATDTRTQSKVHGVSIDISAVVPWWQQWVSELDDNEMWVAHITPETKQQSMHWHHSGSPCKTKFKQASRHGKWCAYCSWTDGSFSSSTSWPEMRQWILSISAKHCRNCDVPFRTSCTGCLTLTMPSTCDIGYMQPFINCQGKSATHFVYFWSRKTLPYTHVETTSIHSIARSKPPHLFHFPIYYRLLQKKVHYKKFFSVPCISRFATAILSGETQRLAL